MKKMNQMLGQWDDCPIDPGTQRIILIVGFKVFLFDLVLAYQDFSLFSNNFSTLKAEIVILVFLKVQDPDQIYDLRQDKTFYFFCE